MLLFILQEMPLVIPLRLFAAAELLFALPCVQLHSCSQGKLGFIHPAGTTSFLKKKQV